MVLDTGHSQLRLSSLARAREEEVCEGGTVNLF